METTDRPTEAKERKRRKAMKWNQPTIPLNKSIVHCYWILCDVEQQQAKIQWTRNNVHCDSTELGVFVYFMCLATIISMHSKSIYQFYGDIVYFFNAKRVEFVCIIQTCFLHPIFRSIVRMHNNPCIICCNFSVIYHVFYRFIVCGWLDLNCIYTSSFSDG